VYPNTNGTDESRMSTFESDLAAQLAFQQRWKVASMIGYVATTVGMLVSSAGATVCAAKGLSDVAAILSALSTVLIGIETSFLFREKWKFHLVVFTKLNLLKTNLLLRRVSLAEASQEYATILSLYATELPMSAREQAQRSGQ